MDSAKFVKFVRVFFDAYTDILDSEGADGMLDSEREESFKCMCRLGDMLAERCSGKVKLTHTGEVWSGTATFNTADGKAVTAGTPDKVEEKEKEDPRASSASVKAWSDVPKKALWDLYIKDKMTSKQIAERYGVSVSAVMQRLYRLGIRKGGKR